MSETFRHVDRDQTIVFGAGALDAAGELIGDGYTLLTTARAAGSAPALVERAASVVHVPAGPGGGVGAHLRRGRERERRRGPGRGPGRPRGTAAGPPGRPGAGAAGAPAPSAAG